MPCPLDSNHKLPLVTGTGPGDSLWYDLALFVHATLEALLILVIDIDIFAVTKPARALLPLLLVFPLRARWPV